MRTYAEPAVTLVRGRGSEVFDSEGRRYLDFIAGIAVVSLGHSHPRVAAAIAAQAQTLSHVSNLFGNAVGPEVALELDRLVGDGAPAGGQVFLANSGAEANECAIKLARKHGGGRRFVVVSAWESFHGRTLATLHATGQKAKHAPFEPMPEGFVHVPYDEEAALESALRDERVAAVLLEPIQGEAGVIEPKPGYLRAARELCTQHGALLMLDEIQTGLGRTGRWFGFHHAGVLPDVVTVAKALGNGMPIGACWARREVADSFLPGDHGSTFGGQPLASAAALATLATMVELDVPATAAKSGERLRAAIDGIAGVAGVRGRGLLLGVELDEGLEAPAVVARSLARGLLVNAPRHDTIRLAPPLLVSTGEIDQAASILASSIAEVQA
jgi:predicted acetylornithine/succinylornithine family transaminase